MVRASRGLRAFDRPLAHHLGLGVAARGLIQGRQVVEADAKGRVVGCELRLPHAEGLRPRGAGLRIVPGLVGSPAFHVQIVSPDQRFGRRHQAGRGREMPSRNPVVQAREGQLAALGAQRRGIEPELVGARERRVLRLGQQAVGPLVVAPFDRRMRLLLDRLHVRACRAHARDLRQQGFVPFGDLAELGRQLLDRHVLLAERAQEGRHGLLCDPEPGRQADDLRRRLRLNQLLHLLRREPDRDAAVPDVAAGGDAVLGHDIPGRARERRPEPEH